MTDPREEVRAAGGLVTRDGEVLLVHRPRYDDWSLPKGKLDPGESFEDAAVREVREETGIDAELREELEPVHYADRKGRPKVVRYWRMEVVGEDRFEPNDEVDELRWLPAQEAADLLSYPHDRELVTDWARRGVEIERKFLVNHRPDGLEHAPRRQVAQGYLVRGDVEVRLRRADDETFLTIKAGQGLVRAEEEMPIERERFERLWPLTRGRRVVKVRHLLDHDGHTIELDVYSGANEGLMTAEVEFTGEDDARAWQPPEWLGEEVTDDPSYRNAQLAS